MERGIWIGICLFLCVISGCGEASRSYFEEASEAADKAVIESETAEAANGIETESEMDSDCYVYICGAVVHPGVYQLPVGSRIYEVVSAAGGLSADACEDSINQAKEEKTVPGEEDEVRRQESGHKVNLNTAEAGELMTLPGIGETKAEQILSYREEKGGFSSIEEIMNITGIKEGVYSKIKDYITVN